MTRPMEMLQPHYINTIGLVYNSVYPFTAQPVTSFTKLLTTLWILGYLTYLAVLSHSSSTHDRYIIMQPLFSAVVITDHQVIFLSEATELDMGTLTGRSVEE